MKVLWVNGGILDYGGISSYLMNYYRNINKEDMVIDFVVQGDGENQFKEEISQNGGNIYQIPNKSKNLYKNIRKLTEILNSGNYDIVHAHADAGNGLILKLAKKENIKVRISHSHSTNCLLKSRVRRILNDLQRKAIRNYATDLWGCSEEACQWLYGVETGYTIIHNAIDTSKYSFDPNIRNTIRKRFFLEEELALCQIGHLGYIKNQQFSIRLLNEMKQTYPDVKVKLFMIGSGEKSQLVELAKEFHLEKDIVFLGQRTDVNEILQGMDGLLQPSLFEGFPVTLVEAQAAGIKCYVSERISHSVALVPELIDFLPVDERQIMRWASEIVENRNYKRSVSQQVLERKGFDIKTEAKKLREDYYKLLEREKR